VVFVFLSDRKPVTKVYLHTFGCKANQYDTEVVRQALESAGAVPVEDPAEADAAVVNSCTVTHVSEAKMRSLVRRLARRNRTIRTVVMGCASALDGTAVASLPSVVGVVPGAAPGPVLKALGLRPTQVDPILRTFAGGSRAWLKIQDGCDEHCTFCATTVARGNSRSRRPEDVVAEAYALADRHCEIVLTGVHVGAYGADLDGAMCLGELLERLVYEVPCVRFRLTSVEATELDDRLVDIMKAAPDRLAPHVHAPLQSGSDRVLRQMGRHWYTSGSYRARIEWLADRIPYLGLGADVMVGFPTESEEDHAATRAMIEALPFTYLHVFPYSEREDARARKLGPPVHPDTWRGRSSELRELARQKAAKYRKLQHGRKADVVLLQRAGGRFEGLTEDYLPVFVPTDRTAPKRFAAELQLDGARLKTCPVAE